MFRFASILYPVEVAFERYFGIACPDLSYLIAIIGLTDMLNNIRFVFL